MYRHHRDDAPTYALAPVEAPTDHVLTLAEAYQQLKLDADFGTSPPSRIDDDHILACVDAAAGELDGATGWLGRALLAQSWRLSMDYFPSEPVVLPLPPLISVDEVSYLDGDGVRQTLLVDTDYRVGVEDPDRPYIAPAYGRRFPTGRRQGDAVQITYTCGYGEASDIPALIKQFIKNRLGFYYENREPIVVGTITSEIPTGADILENYRVRGLIR